MDGLAIAKSSKPSLVTNSTQKPYVWNTFDNCPTKNSINRSII